MEFGSDYLDYFHYSDGMGYLIFCCHSVASKLRTIHILITYKDILIKLSGQLDDFLHIIHDKNFLVAYSHLFCFQSFFSTSSVLQIIVVKFFAPR